jgi:hypothetical protein
MNDVNDTTSEPPAVYPPTAHERIAAALERIASAMERQAPVPANPPHVFGGGEVRIQDMNATRET